MSAAKNITIGTILSLIGIIGFMTYITGVRITQFPLIWSIGIGFVWHLCICVAAFQISHFSLRPMNEFMFRCGWLHLVMLFGLIAIRSIQSMMV